MTEGQRFPPWHEQPARNAFVGRERECRTVTRLLDDHARLITVTGPGGCGKTRLAIEVGEQFCSNEGWRLAFVELAAVRDPALLIGEIAKTLALRDSAGRAAIDDLARCLESEDRLLVLDNVEQLLPEGARSIAAIIGRCPSVRLLVTSRVALNVSAERLLRLDPLAVPVAGAELPQITTAPAVAVFVERARTVDPEFVLDEGNADDVAALCRQLDGLPLAIELAASRVRVLSPAAIRDRLQRGLWLLTGGALDGPDRQQTLSDTIRWSVDLLPPREALLFPRLGVFAGSFDVAAALEIAAPGITDSEDELLDALTLLVDHNLIRAAAHGAEPRFSMLQTIREYAIEHVDDADALRDRHLAFYLGLVEEAGAALDSRAHAMAAHRLAAASADTRAALAWADETRQAEIMLRMTAALGLYWRVHGDLREGRAWLERSIALHGSTPHPALAMAIIALGRICLVLGDRSVFPENPQRALEAARACGDRRAEGWALLGSAIPYVESGDLVKALTPLKSALDIGREVDDDGITCYSLIQLGQIQWDADDIDAARAHLEQAIEVADRAGNSMRHGVALGHLGDLLLAAGESARALECFSESYRMTVTLDARDHLGWAVLGRASALVDLGRLDEARIAIEEGLDLGSRTASRSDQVQALATMAAWLGVAGRPREALRALGAIERVRERFAVAFSRSASERSASLALRYRRAAGEPAATVAWELGRSTDLASAVEMARRWMESTDPCAPRPLMIRPRGSVLTPREVEILVLIGQGLSDGEIAAELSISKKTASSHVANVKSKLGTDSRVQTAMEAVRIGLVTSTVNESHGRP